MAKEGLGMYKSYAELQKSPRILHVAPLIKKDGVGDGERIFGLVLL